MLIIACLSTFELSTASAQSMQDDLKVWHDENASDSTRLVAGGRIIRSMSDSLEFVTQDVLPAEHDQKQRIGMLAVGGGVLLLLTLGFSIYSGKKKSDQLLLNILPYETALELKKEGRSKARSIKDVTVLFTDFEGFSEISQRLPPELLVQEMHECFSAFDRIMEVYGVEKIKTIGDAYMAAGGVPIPNSTHPENVVDAALEIRNFMVGWSEDRRSEGKPHFRIRIGVHTGPVVTGIVGIKKFQYDIWGDTVNTAARMESSAKVGEVNISESTFQLVKDRFQCEHRGKVVVKGKGEIDMYTVVSRA